MLDYVRSHVPEPRKAPLAGSSVYVDRGFLARDMPELDAYLHYRLIDVSSIKELVRRWYPRVYFNSPPKTRQPPRPGRRPRDRSPSCATTARPSWSPQPGPDTDAAREIAARHVRSTTRPDLGRSGGRRSRRRDRSPGADFGHRARPPVHSCAVAALRRVIHPEARSWWV